MGGIAAFGFLSALFLLTAAASAEVPSTAVTRTVCGANLLVSPEGWERWYLRPAAFLKRVRSAHWYELCGSVGLDARQTFVVGPSADITMEKDGEIFLFANDACDRYGNNRGALRVRLARIK